MGEQPKNVDLFTTTRPIVIEARKKMENANLSKDTKNLLEELCQAIDGLVVTHIINERSIRELFRKSEIPEKDIELVLEVARDGFWKYHDILNDIYMKDIKED